MTYEQAMAKVGELRDRFDAPFNSSDKATIELLYEEVTRKHFVPTTCQQCYHDALIEIYLKLKNEKAMPKKCNYRMRAGFIISCPDFYGGKIFTNENLTDKVAKEYLTKYPAMLDYFQSVPEDGDAAEEGDSAGKEQPTEDGDSEEGKEESKGK